MGCARETQAALPGYTSHPTPNTLHHSPYTLHPTPYTLHPTPATHIRFSPGGNTQEQAAQRRRRAALDAHFTPRDKPTVRKPQTPHG